MVDGGINVLQIQLIKNPREELVVSHNFRVNYRVVDNLIGLADQLNAVEVGLLDLTLGVEKEHHVKESNQGNPANKIEY